MVLEKTLGSSLHCKEIKSVSPKWNQSWIFIGRTDAEAETLILWIPDVKSRLTRKHPDFGKDWRQERRAWQKTSWLDGIPIQWTWVSASSRRWWRAGKPGVLQSMRSQRVGHDWATEQQVWDTYKTSKWKHQVGSVGCVSLRFKEFLWLDSLAKLGYFNPRE